MVENQDNLIKEIQKARSAPHYYTKYVKIRHPKAGLVKCELFSWQLDAMRIFTKNRFVCVLKSRQIGCSSLVQLYSLWLVNFFKGQEVLILSKSDREAKKHIKFIKEYYESLPFWLKSKVVKSNDHCLELSLTGNLVGTSSVTAVPSSPEIGRSFSASLLIIDEAAFIPKIEDIWQAVSPTIATGGSCIVISTPKQVNSWFHHLWTGAVKKENDFYPLKVHWSQLPLEEFKRRGFETKEEWYKDECRKLKDKKKIASELELSFIASGDTFVEGDLLKKIEEEILLNPNHWSRRPLRVWDKMKVWEEPIPKITYVVGADVAEGVGRASSTIHVINPYTKKIALEFGSNTESPREFAKRLYTVALHYNKAILNIENNNHGHTVISILLNDYGYNKIMNTYDFTTGSWGTRIGWEETTRTRVFLLDVLREYIWDRWMDLTPEIATELLTFIEKNGKVKALSGYHDDYIFSFGLALVGVKYYDKFIDEVWSTRYSTPSILPEIDFCSEGMGEEDITLGIQKMVTGRWKPVEGYLDDLL